MIPICLEKIKGLLMKEKYFEMKNYNSKREELEQEDQGEDERNVIL